jgi:hypothetical protein
MRNRNCMAEPGCLAPGQALRLPRAGGELTVLRGRLWLTRNNDLGDHFIEAGQCVHLDANENAVVEPAGSSQGASLHWEPHRPGLFGALLARPLNGTAFLAFVGGPRLHGAGTQRRSGRQACARPWPNQRSPCRVHRAGSAAA